MTNIDNEDQPGSSKNNMLGNTQVKVMLDHKRMKMIMKKFKNCTEIKHSNHSNIVTEHVKGVKKLYEIFRKFIKDSSNFSNRLRNYSFHILFFTERFNDKNCSDEEILVLLNDLLEESIENHRLAKELEKRLFVDEEDGGFVKELKKLLNRIFYGKGDVRNMNELKKIKSSLQEHIQDFQNKINSDEKALTSYVSYEDSWTYKFCIKVAMFLDDAKEAVTREKVTKETSYEEDVKNTAKKWEEEEKKAISDQLSNNQNELNIMNLFDENLRTIIMGVSKIKTFWEEQIMSIEDIIKNLDQFRGGQNIQRRRIVYVLEQRWKNVERDCQIYNEAMNDVLDNDEV